MASLCPVQQAAHLGECVDSQDGQVWLRLGVVHEIQVDQLLELQVVGLHAVDHIGKQGAHILAYCHASDDLLNRFLLLLLLITLQVDPQLGQLA